MDAEENIFSQANCLDSYRHITVMDFTDLTVINRFMNLLKGDSDTALSYICQWDYGEYSTEDALERRKIFDGLCFHNYVENENYLALWQIGIEAITLFAKVVEEQ